MQHVCSCTYVLFLSFLRTANQSSSTSSPPYLCFFFFIYFFYSFAFALFLPTLPCTSLPFYPTPLLSNLIYSALYHTVSLYSALYYNFHSFGSLIAFILFCSILLFLPPPLPRCQPAMVPCTSITDTDIDIISPGKRMQLMFSCPTQRQKD